MESFVKDPVICFTFFNLYMMNVQSVSIIVNQIENPNLVSSVATFSLYPVGWQVNLDSVGELNGFVLA